ncbi:MAG: cell wall hydrolase [Eubacteriales bacterium]|nr:cell wall hydrolase [Eubacteriales bacterium]
MKKRRIAVFLTLVFVLLFVCSGTAQAGWKKASGGRWKYQVAKTKTYVKSSWKQIGKKWYYFDSKGYMKSGRFKVGKNYYYSKKSTGRLQNKKMGNYYYGANGAMVSNCWKKCGKYTYYFGADGKLKTGRIKLNGKVYYCDKKTGKAVKKKIGDYYYGPDGAMVTNKWVGNYYYGQDGKAKYGKFTVGGKTYCCLKKSGKVKNQWYNKNYYDKNGVMATNKWVDGSYVDASGKITKGNKNPKNKPSAADVKLLASITFGEAGNQSYRGMVAVASVVINRVKSSKFPNTLKGVIFQSGQFAAIYSSYFNRAYYGGTLYGWEKTSYANCKKAATEVLTDGSKLKGYYYFNTGYGRLKIGDHWFS